MLRTTHDQAHILVKNFAKFYPNGKIKVFQYEKEFFKRKDGFEPAEEADPTTGEATPKTEISDFKNAERSLRRTKTLISDIVLCTEFDMFATFTFAKDRQDLKKCKAKMKDWLKSQRKIHGPFEYLIVPEFHKDKKSLHFHALLRGYKGYIKYSGKKINNRKAYNITSYRKGFSTVIKIDNVEKVASYIKKYITKEMPNTGKGQKRYWNSTGLLRPHIEYNINLNDYKLTEVYAQDFFTISEAVVQCESQPIKLRSM